MYGAGWHKTQHKLCFLRTFITYPRPWVYRPTRVGISNHGGGAIEPPGWVSKESTQEGKPKYVQRRRKVAARRKRRRLQAWDGHVAACSRLRFFHSCQLLMMFCHSTYEPGPTDESGLRYV